MKRNNAKQSPAISIRTKKRMIRVCRALDALEINTGSIAENLIAIFSKLDEKHEREETQNREVQVLMLSKKKQQEFRESWLDRQEVMQLMPISDRSLYDLTKRGDLPSYTFKGKLFFKLSDVEALMKRRGGGDGGERRIAV
ncbi:helix-turn-helix domain-containing protein [Desertivirga arenae]|uniref:helix-turn-helix domain-containing protein n=1 Tax=Desertivirga arenae TaxID=2810309 RepID=UPI001A96669B|nr:helix-turn-helix domain-containing protein [Pedobacter sp. SYSU D00823]